MIPQMSPYNWLLLNLIFLMTYMIFIIMLNFIPMNKNFKSNFKNKSIYNIKW